MKPQGQVLFKFCITSVSWKITPLYFFQLKPHILWTKIAHRSEIFSDFLVVGWKFTKFLMSFLEPRVSFSSNFALLFSVMKHNSAVFFHLNFICFGLKAPMKVQIFRLSTACMKINQILYVIFQATCQFSFKICITFQCHDK